MEVERYYAYVLYKMLRARARVYGWLWRRVSECVRITLSDQETLPSLFQWFQSSEVVFHLKSSAIEDVLICVGFTVYSKTCMCVAYEECG